MARIDLIMPKMGESIMEATILKWVKNVGDKVSLDETILEIATDKVDSDIPSPVEGTIVEILFEEDSVVPVGETIAVIATEGEESAPEASPAIKEPVSSTGEALPQEAEKMVETAVETVKTPVPAAASTSLNGGERFYSPLVRNIAQKENISRGELDTIPGTGAKGRVTKKDILAYVENRTTKTTVTAAPVIEEKKAAPAVVSTTSSSNGSTRSVSSSENVEILEMDRMRRMIAENMVLSKQTSPHVTSFVEADVTNIVQWRNRNKKGFEEKYGTKITFTPIFIEAVVKAIRDFPLINVSVDGSNIIVKKDINIGMATALPSGNLIVPVIKNADFLNLAGLAKKVNELSSNARNKKLRPDDIQGGTFTISNVGTFGNVMGTPIINQPQVAILAVGAIRKKPAVMETEYGDVIAVRQMMYLSLSYDHRVVDGFLGGSFLRKIADYLEQFDGDRDI